MLFEIPNTGKRCLHWSKWSIFQISIGAFTPPLLSVGLIQNNVSHANKIVGSQCEGKNALHLPKTS